MLLNWEISAVLMGHFTFLTIFLDCMTPLGMENGQIPDSSIKASSEVSAIYIETTESLRFELKKKMKLKRLMFPSYKG